MNIIIHTPNMISYRIGNLSQEVCYHIPKPFNKLNKNISLFNSANRDLHSFKSLPKYKRGTTELLIACTTTRQSVSTSILLTRCSLIQLRDSFTTIASAFSGAMLPNKILIWLPLPPFYGFLRKSIAVAVSCSKNYGITIHLNHIITWYSHPHWSNDLGKDQRFCLEHISIN